MDAMTASAILAEQLDACGLSVTNQDQDAVSVTNPLHPGLGEIVTAQGGRYLTDYGYEIDEHGDEHATADRVAFLLGLPRVRLPQQSIARPEVVR
jgi:hypothetical protein